MDAESSAKRGDRDGLDHRSAVPDELARQVLEQYSQRLKALVRRHLDQRIRQKVGTSDVVQSAFKSFFRRKSSLADPNNLMGVLAGFTNNKIAQAIQKYQTKMRDFRRERPLLSVEDDDSSFTPPELDLIARGPSPEEVERVRERLQSLNKNEQLVVSLRLDNYTEAEIAKKLQCSERTVRRTIKTIQEKWRRLSDAEGT